MAAELLQPEFYCSVKEIKGKENCESFLREMGNMDFGKMVSDVKAEDELDVMKMRDKYFKNENNPEKKLIEKDSFSVVLRDGKQPVIEVQKKFSSEEIDKVLEKNKPTDDLSDDLKSYLNIQYANGNVINPNMEHWKIEGNECSSVSGVSNYTNCVVTYDLLEELKLLDNRLFIDPERGYHKFYFDHLVDGNVTEHIRVDLGDGVHANAEFYKYLKDSLDGISEKMCAERAVYWIAFDNNENSDSINTLYTLQEAKDFIRQNNGTINSYFADYPGGMVSIINNETEQTVFMKDILQVGQKEKQEKKCGFIPSKKVNTKKNNNLKI